MLGHTFKFSELRDFNSEQIAGSQNSQKRVSIPVQSRAAEINPDFQNAACDRTLKSCSRAAVFIYFDRAWSCSFFSVCTATQVAHPSISTLNQFTLKVTKTFTQEEVNTTLCCMRTWSVWKLTGKGCNVFRLLSVMFWSEAELHWGQLKMSKERTLHQLCTSCCAGIACSHARWVTSHLHALDQRCVVRGGKWGMASPVTMERKKKILDNFF